MSELREMVADLVRFNKDPLAIAEEAIALIRADTLEEAAKEMLKQRERWRPDEAASAIRDLKGRT